MTGPVTTEAHVEGSAEPMTEAEIAAIMAEDPNCPPCPAPPPIPVRERYYLTECEHCGWVGSSEQCGGDAYPGDDDIVCPVCCSSIRGDSPNEADTAKHGEAVYQRIVQAEAALQQVTAERDEARAKLRSACLDALAAQDQAAENDERARTAEASLATATSELARLRAEGEGLREGAARLDFLDGCNARLNASYGTHYGWKLVLNHNVNRLVLGDMKVDLHDSEGGNDKLPSCRLAIDEARKRTALARAATAREGA